ncbi:glutathione peroxidase [Nitrospira lenta]|uniref:Glutathione peroxidase n=1 Tax=Nitrospira lenta TaxID=1436998 RepID=A0A330KZW9_9BACT|nr:glutathione peroxidase [Nitrospira lenta]SPP63048.1 Hydroperoxy fatty acid reductase gpx1 [Nitrospira lenta]
MKAFITAASLMTLMSGLLLAAPDVRAEQEGLLMAAKTTSLYDFTMNDIDGKPVNLGQYKGKALLLVNTASFCGNTPQYTELEAIYEQYHAKGFEVLAFPANNFGQQEPGTNAEIKGFCLTKYSVSFPLFSKISVKGSDKHPLYQYLTENSPFPGEVEWNFQKYLVDRNGNIVARFPHRMKPSSPEIVQEVERVLAAK